MTLPSDPVLGQIGTDESGRQYRCSDATNKLWDLVSTLGPGVRKQVFTSSNTYTPSPGTRLCIVRVTAPGGGSGGVDASSATNSQAASGGGGPGETREKFYTANELGASAAITLGSPGTAGADTGTDGGDGGDAVFDPAGSGETLTSKGGKGGKGAIGAANASASGDGGAVPTGGSGGTLIWTGSGHAATDNQAAAGAGTRMNAGRGGNSLYGTGGKPALMLSTGTEAGVAAPNYGAGAAGATLRTTVSGAAGAVGGGAYVEIIELVGDSVSTADIFDHLQELTSVDGASDFLLGRDTDALLNKKIKPQNLKRAGGMQLLAEGTVSAAATLDIALDAFPDYQNFKLFVTELVPQTDGTTIYVRASVDGGANFLAGASDYAWMYRGANMATSVTQFLSGDDADTKISIGGDAGTAANETHEHEITIFDPHDTRYSRLSWHGSKRGPDGTRWSFNGAAEILSTSAKTDIRLLMSSGNINLKYKLYGLI